MIEKEETKYPRLTRTDHIILKELCKNSSSYLKIDLTKLSKATRLARNTVSVRTEKLLKQNLLKLIAIENLELEAYEGMLCLLKLKTTTKPEIYIKLIEDLKKEKSIETLWEITAHQEGKRGIAFILRYLAPYRLVGTKTYLRERISMVGEIYMKLIGNYAKWIDTVGSYLLLDTPKLLFYHKLSNFDLKTGKIIP